VLAAHPGRFEIVERNPAISKSEALEEMRKWRAAQAGTATPTDQADEDDFEDDTGSTPVATASTPANAIWKSLCNGRKHWKRDVSICFVI
jgi:hypothetical protein